VEGFREAVLFNRVYNVYWLSALLLKSKNVHFAIKHARLGPYKGPLLQGYLVILITCRGPTRNLEFPIQCIHVDNRAILGMHAPMAHRVSFIKLFYYLRSCPLSLFPLFLTKPVKLFSLGELNKDGFRERGHNLNEALFYFLCILGVYALLL
jgi:hypothetical protein